PREALGCSETQRLITRQKMHALIVPGLTANEPDTVIVRSVVPHPEAPVGVCLIFQAAQKLRQESRSVVDRTNDVHVHAGPPLVIIHPARQSDIKLPRMMQFRSLILGCACLASIFATAGRAQTGSDAPAMFSLDRGDVLRVYVWRELDLSGDFAVDEV